MKAYNSAGKSHDDTVVAPRPTPAPIPDTQVRYEITGTATKVDVNNSLEFDAIVIPNPFKNNAILAYTLPESGKVNCKIYAAFYP